MINKIAIVTQKFSPSLRKIIGNTAWLFGDRVLRMGVGLFVGVWIARYLGPEQFGLFNYVIAFASLFDTVANLGLNSIVVRNLVREPSCKNEVLGTAFILKLSAQIVALLLAVGSVFLLHPYNNQNHWLVGIIAAGMIFEAFDVIDFWFQSQLQSKYTVLAKNLGFILTNLGKIILLHMRAPLIMFACIWSVEIALGAMGLVIAYQFQGHLLKAWRYSLSYAKGLLKDSWTLILSSIVIMIYMRTDQLMLGQMLDAQAVGVYSAAVKISELWYFVPVAITNSVFPLIIEAKKISEKLYYQRIHKLFCLLTILSYIVAIIVTFTSSHLITLFFGKDYIQAGAILTIHIWTGLFVSLGLVRSSWTTTEGLMSFAFASSAIGALINIALNYFFIQSYGAIGSAISTVIAQIFASYIANLFFPMTRKIFWLQTKAIIIPIATGIL